MNSFVRNVGGSIGIAGISSLLTRQAAKHQSYLVAHAAPGNGTFDQMANGMGQRFADHGVGQPMQHAYSRITGLIAGQATTLAYIDVISLLALVVACMIPLVLIMRRPKASQAARAAAH